MASNTAGSTADHLLDAVTGRFQWPRDAALYYLPPERELLPDKARRLVFQAYLRLSSLSYIEHNTAVNTDYMSPSGESPFLVVSFGTRPIIFHNIFQLITFLEIQKFSIGQDLDKREKAEHDAYVSLIRTAILPALDYETWSSPSSRKETLASYSHGLPWPLSYIVPYSQYIRHCWNHWDNYWQDETTVHNRFDEACYALSVRLGTNDSFYQSGPTALDALLIGCIEAVMGSSTPLMNIMSAYENIVEFCNSSVLMHRRGLQFITSPSSLHLANTTTTTN